VVVVETPNLGVSTYFISGGFQPQGVGCVYPGLITETPNLGVSTGGLGDYLILNTLSSIGTSTSTFVNVVTISIPLAEVVVFIGTRIPFVSV